jgi:hypothetical protein
MGHHHFGRTEAQNQRWIHVLQQEIMQYTMDDFTTYLKSASHLISKFCIEW